MLKRNSSKMQGLPEVPQGEISARSEHILIRSLSVHSSSTAANIQTMGSLREHFLLFGIISWVHQLRHNAQLMSYAASAA